MNLFRFFTSALAVLTAVPVLAQAKAEPTEPIETDRPDFTESAVVVPFRWLQIESGLTYQTARGSRDLSGPEALFRYGFRPKVEMRIGLPDYNVARAGGRRFTGFGDLYLGAKLQLGPLRDGSDLSIIPAVFVPDGNRDFSSGAVDPELKVCYRRDLGGPWGLSVMEYGSLPTVDGRHRFTFQQTASLGRELTERLGMFVEYAGTFSRFDRPEHVAHVGLAYRPSRDSQFDVHGGETLGGSDRRPFVAGGYSMRF